MEGPILEGRLSSLSIVVDDVDEKQTKESNKVMVETDQEPQETVTSSPESQKHIQWTHNPYPKHVLMAASAKIKNDAATRKKNFSKLIDEYEALVKYVEKMEQENVSLSPICKMTHSTIMT